MSVANRWTDFVSSERAQNERERGEQVNSEYTEDYDEHDVIVGVQHELPVSTVTVQLLVDLLLLMLLMLMWRTHLFTYSTVMH